jgi:uncharacterized protein (TIGR02646 family)
LAKGNPPVVLVDNETTWTAEFASFQRADDGVPEAAARRYAHQDIRDALREETKRKCAYCESRIEHVDYVHIEHIFPKARRPELVCKWENLTLACRRCNTNKGEYYEPTCELVNPYQDDIQAHLIFAGPLVVHRSPDRGRVTISKIDLNRPELMARRKDAIENVQRVLDLLGTQDDGPVKEALEDELDELIGEGGEFSATTEVFVRAANDGS